MSNFTGVPRPGSLRDILRGQEEEARRREQATSARNTSSTTVGAGGRLDIDGGDFSVFNGGNAVVRDGGRFLVQGGGSMDITDDGQVNVIGNGRGWSSNQLIKVVASFANRMAYNAWIGFSYLVPGLYFTAEGESQGPYDPRVVSEYGKDVSAISAVEKLPYGPQVGPTILAKSSFSAGPWSAGVGSYAWDDALNPGGGDGLVGLRGEGSVSVTPYSINVMLANQTDGPDGIPSGPAVWIHGTLEDGKLELYGRNGVNVTGPFTINGSPITSPVTSVAGKTGAVTLVKADVGLGNVDNTSDAGKPISTATQTALNGKAATNHTHTTAQVTGLDTALAGKASTALATSSTAGLMPASDKAKLDAATAAATPNTLILLDGSGRAKVTAPAVAADISNKGYVDALTLRFQLVPGTSLPATVTSAWSNLASNVTVPADLFGAGVPYRISVFGQVQANPTTGLIISLRAVFNGATPAGAKVNGTPGPNNASVQVVGDFLVTTSQAVTVNCQASAPFGGVPRGSGDDAPFFTITVTPYLAL